MEYNPLVLSLLVAVLTNLLGKIVCERAPQLPRLLWWLGILLPYTAIHLLMLDSASFARMVGLCSSLLLGMKVITYMEWKRQGGTALLGWRWLAFSFLWFGMQPKAWTTPRRSLEWKSHLRSALLSMSLGAVGLSSYVLCDLHYFPLSFIFMSMMFHYGVLRLNTTLWRLVGFPVRTLFRNPLVTDGFKDFWGARWNLAYSQMMSRAVQRPLSPILGQKGALFAVFVVSGFFHELAITVIIKESYGLPFCFFLFHGFAVLLEKPIKGLGILCLLSLILGLPVLFPAGFVEHIIHPVEREWLHLLIKIGSTLKS